MDERLKQLMDYTKFHIGLYTTLLAGLVLFVSNDFAASVHKTFYYWLAATTVCFLIAGMAGGLVASSIPDYQRYEAFIEATLGPWWKPDLWTARTCTQIEHTAFWAGAVVAILGLAVSVYAGPTGACGH